MGLYRIEIKKTDNTIIEKMDLDYSVNLKMLLPFAIEEYSDQLIKIELLNEETVLSSIFVSLENLFLSVKTIRAFYSNRNNESQLIIKNESKKEVKKQESLLKTKNIKLNNEKALAFYFKSKIRKYAFYTIILIMVVGFALKATKDLGNGNLLSMVSGIALIFISIFTLLAAIIIIKKVEYKNK